MDGYLKIKLDVSLTGTLWSPNLTTRYQRILACFVKMT